MKILLVAVSQKTPDWVKTACDIYRKRLPRDWQLTIRDVKPTPRQQGKTVEQIKAEEGARLLAVLREHSGFKIALDERGKALSTLQFHELLQRQKTEYPEVILVIGGPDGLDPQVSKACHMQMQLSALTLPHTMVKVLVHEQIYRVAAIANQHPYHRE